MWMKSIWEQIDDNGYCLKKKVTLNKENPPFFSSTCLNTESELLLKRNSRNVSSRLVSKDQSTDPQTQLSPISDVGPPLLSNNPQSNEDLEKWTTSPTSQRTKHTVNFRIFKCYNNVVCSHTTCKWTINSCRNMKYSGAVTRVCEYTYSQQCADVVDAVLRELDT